MIESTFTVHMIYEFRELTSNNRNVALHIYRIGHSFLRKISFIVVIHSYSADKTNVVSIRDFLDFAETKRFSLFSSPYCKQSTESCIVMLVQFIYHRWRKKRHSDVIHLIKLLFISFVLLYVLGCDLTT